MNVSEPIATRKIHPRSPAAMRWRKTFALLFALVVSLAGNLRAQLSGTLVDFGGTAPTPGADDVSQLTSPAGANKPDGLNYYFDNGNPPGQTFTTGSNPNGYVLNAVYVQTAGDGNLPAGGQIYQLNLYSVSGGTATLMYSFTSQSAFTFTELDWLLWTNLTPVGLQPNTQYAYTLHRVNTGWENLGNVTGNLYPGGEVCLIPPAGGTITFGTSHSFDATFSVGLTPATTITVNPPVITPQSPVLVGTAVTISTPPAVGPGPFTYQWRTDGGSGGTLTNIPSATGTNYSLNTATVLPGTYQYAVVASSGSGSVTSAPVSLAIFQRTSATLADVGASFAPGQYDVSQLTESTTQNGDGLNYYDDNNNPPGQVFTTGTNSQGYYLSSISIGTGGGTFNSTTTPQGYNLWLYSMNGNTATLLINYTNPSSSFVYGDWVTWKFSPFILKPNSTYAYSFHRNSAGWAGMATDPGTSDLYSGGQICLIPQGGGPVALGGSGTVDAAFDIGVVPIGVAPTVPFANGITVSPSQFVVTGTPVTLGEIPTGATPFYYQWQTDGGTGTFTNIPSSNFSNLVWNTSGAIAGNYQFDVIVTNNYGASTSVVTTVTLTYADTSASLTDIGNATPMPLPDDISQLQGLGPRKPDNLNYYTDNGSPPGQTFITGSDPNGYTLTSLAVHTAGDSGNLPATGQAYQLRLYAVSGSNAVLYATYTSQSNFVFVDNDWLRWSGLSLPLAKNTTYAYAFGRIQSGSGWENMDNLGGNPYPDGELALLPLFGGQITFGSSDSYDATFVLGLAISGFPNVAPPAFSPSDTVYAGTPLTVNAPVSGAGPFTYQWQTDGGNTGTFTNIPTGTSATLSVDTTTLSGIVAYRLMASNGSGSTTGELASVTINPASPPMVTSPFSLSENNLAIVGGTVTLQVNEAGTLPITNRWTFNGAPLTDNGHITGSTGNVLTITNVQSGDAGYYQLNITNSVGAYTTYPGGGADQNLSVVPVPTFFTNGPGWVLNGSPANTVPTIANNLLTLTSGGGNVSAFFLNSSIYIGAFQASFIYQDVGGGGADGFTLCFENDPRGAQVLGAGGGALGVLGISPSAELTFNIYGPNIPGIAFGTNGANGSPYNPTTPVDISSGDAIAINVVYTGGVLQVTLTDTNTSATFSTNFPVDIPGILGTRQAYVGFTGASGGVASTQTITDFLYVPLTTLGAQVSGSKIILNWPLLPGGYTLQSTPSLSPANWQPATGTMNQANGQNQVTNGTGGGSQFYRLSIPIPPQ